MTLQVPCNPAELAGFSSMNRSCSSTSFVTSLGVANAPEHAHKKRRCSGCNDSGHWKKTSAQASFKSPRFNTPVNPQVSCDTAFVRSSNLAANEVKVNVDLKACAVDDVRFYDSKDYPVQSRGFKSRSRSVCLSETTGVSCRGKEDSNEVELTSIRMPVSTESESKVKNKTVNKLSYDANGED